MDRDLEIEKNVIDPVRKGKWVGFRQRKKVATTTAYG